MIGLYSLCTVMDTPKLRNKDTLDVGNLEALHV